MKFLEFDDIRKKNSAFLNLNWVRFNEDYYNLKSEEIDLEYKGARLVGRLYKNKRGKYCLPMMDRYLALRFIPTSTSKEYRFYNQQLELMAELAKCIIKTGYEGELVLPPGFVDARSFSWEGNRVTLNYTFLGELPLKEESIDSSVKKYIKKAEKLGYSVKSTTDWEKVVYCYNKTREYKKLGKYVTVDWLECLQRYSGNQSFINAYLAETQDGEPVCAQIKMFEENGICLDLVAGTDREHIANGVNQLTYYKTIEELSKRGGAYFDYCGANDYNVSQAKSHWGMELVPCIAISKGSKFERVKVAVKNNEILAGTYRKVKVQIKR